MYDTTSGMKFKQIHSITKERDMKKFRKIFIMVFVLAFIVGNIIGQNEMIGIGSGHSKLVTTPNHQESIANNTSNYSDSNIMVHGLSINNPNSMEKYKNKTTRHKLFKNKKNIHRFNKKANTNNDEDISWNLKTINKNNIQSSNTINKIKVALIDSGVNYTEAINVAERKNFIPGEDEVSYLYEDTSGHGTSIASVLCSSDEFGVHGVNPNIELYSAKVLDKNNEAPISRVVDAINWAISQNVNIINISFGTICDSPSLKQAIQDAYDAGILIIAAAGNSGTVEYPAAYDEVMAVGSVKCDGVISDFSPVSEDVEIVAPGEDIVSIAAFDGLMKNSGTSLASPEVVGVASLLWEKDLSVSADFIRQLLDYSANLYGETSSYGNGLVDLNYAQDIYKTFKEVYNTKLSTKTIDDATEISSVMVNNISQNESDINVFDNVNSDYVEGSWYSDPANGNGHQSIFIDAWGNKTTTNLDTYQYYALMYGCKFNDTSSSTISGMTDHPQWHGYLWNGTADNNYINCYIYLSRIANALYQSKNLTTTDDSAISIPATMTNSEHNGMKGIITSSGVGNLSWSTICSNASTSTITVSNLAKNRMAFVYGMAMHTATDVFAHSTFYASSSSTDSSGTTTTNWTRIMHTTSGLHYADDTTFIQARYNAACRVAYHIINRCGSQKDGINTATVFDFQVSNSYFGNPDFLVGNYNFYASHCNCPTMYSSYENDFKYADLYTYINSHNTIPKLNTYDVENHTFE